MHRVRHVSEVGFLLVSAHLCAYFSTLVTRQSLGGVAGGGSGGGCFFILYSLDTVLLLRNTFLMLRFGSSLALLNTFLMLRFGSPLALFN